MKNNRPSERGFNAKAQILKYVHNWPWFLLSIVVCGLLAFICLYYVPPRYEVSAELLFKENGGLSSLNIGNNTGYLEDEIETLSSKDLLISAFEEMPDLQTSIYRIEGIRSREIYTTDAPFQVKVNKINGVNDGEMPEEVHLFVKDTKTFTLSDEPGAPRYVFGRETQRNGVFFTVFAGADITPETDYILQFHHPEQYALKYRELVNIERANKNSEILRISLTDAVPEKAIAILNKFIEVYQRRTLAAANEVAGNIQNFVDSRLRVLTSELTEVAEEAAAFKGRSKMVASSFNMLQFLGMASGYYQELEQARIQRRLLESLLTYINSPGSVYTLVPASLGLKDPALNSLVIMFNKLQLKRKQLLEQVNPSSVLIRSVNRDIAMLKKSIRENLKTIRESMVVTERELSRNYTLFQNHIRAMPEVDRKLLEILRQQGIKKALYTYLLKTGEQARLSKATKVVPFRIMDAPVATKDPVGPQKPLIYIVALTLGLLLPIGILYVRDLLDTKIQVQADITDKTVVPIIGELAHDNTGKRLVVRDKSRTPISEMFRLIRSNLQFAALNKQVQVILTTSSMSGEGKTFFCTNMGASIALTGKRVVVLEFDIRRPKLLKGLGISAQYGITNYVVKPELSLDDLILPVAGVADLYVIGAGPVPPNPAELMFHSRIDQLFRELRDRFDYILLDTSPVGQVADVFNLDRISDACLYLMRYNYTFKQQLPIVNDIYHNRKLRNLMIVLNDAMPKHAKGSGYGHGSGYGYDAEEQSPARRLLQRLAGSYSDAV